MSDERPAALYPLLYEDFVRRALQEDLGRAGDLTSDATLPPGTRAEAMMVARAAGRIAGLPVALAAFSLLDPSIAIEVFSKPATRTSSSISPWVRLRMIQGSPSRLVRTRAMNSTSGCQGWLV